MWRILIMCSGLLCMTIVAAPTRTPPRPAQDKFRPPFSTQDITPIPIPPLDTSIDLKGEVSALSDRLLALEMANGTLEERVRVLETQVEEPSYRRPQKRLVVDGLRWEWEQSSTFNLSSPTVCQETRWTWSQQWQQWGMECVYSHKWASELDGKVEVDGSEWVWEEWSQTVVHRKLIQPADYIPYMPGFSRHRAAEYKTLERYKLDFCLYHGETRVIQWPQR